MYLHRFAAITARQHDFYSFFTKCYYFVVDAGMMIFKKKSFEYKRIKMHLQNIIVFKNTSLPRRGVLLAGAFTGC